MTDNVRELTVSDNIGGDRPVRFCPVCLWADDHPRHVVDDIGSAYVARHMNCCRSIGCPDGTCDVVTAGAEDLRGAELLKHLEGLDRKRTAAEVAVFQAERPELLEAFVAGSPSISLEGAE